MQSPVDPALLSAIGVGDFHVQSQAAVRPYLPPAAVPSIICLLSYLPILVRVVGIRRTKHGDHFHPVGRHYSIITVNDSGNPYLFLITLLHEIAHARIVHEKSARVRPHGREWKLVFGAYLLAHLDCFPKDLQPLLLCHARRPLYSTDADPELSSVLHRYDTRDHRPMLSELRDGQKFWLNSGRAMVKGPLMRKYYRCTDTKGRLFRVAAAARVSITRPEN
ncbi:MAG: hypothetical protein ACOYCD_05185 [Kiritimatiellia bacterium]